jgi:plasmid maintenance system killer protein
MIGSFKDRRAQAIFEGRHPGKGFPANLIRSARRKLIMLSEARALKDLRNPPSNRLEALKHDRAVSTRSGSMINGAFASDGRGKTPRMSRSWTIINLRTRR